MTSLGWSDSLTVAESDGVKSVVAAAHAADGVGPVSDDVALTVRPGSSPAPGRFHLLAADPDPASPESDVAGYAHLAHAGGGAWEAELVVRPDLRRRGVGSALVDALVQRVASESPAEVAAAASPATLDIWAHGDSAAAAALAARGGFERGRVLLQLRRPLVADAGSAGEELPEPTWPADVTVRCFEPGRDERAWLALNARAFASHPEQGRWTEQDLLPREAEPWFDPAGFFLAERDGELVGFHWTKVHAEDPTPPDGRAGPGRALPIGEVYVVGVDPSRAGGGLGRALTLAGLRHLRNRGLTTVMLYTDEDNARAVRMYERLGFTRHAVDAQYRRHVAVGRPGH
ncbi:MULTISPECIES: mycothiol synthase [unclassified Pseudofrankia]|uniref:mycothiol synthase n=1 Tax=unclassified Pseudofrankia TaxID=2994372 RepID=UPI0008D8F699|nr:MULTISPECIES: mycothiol synthase [unclassified Pseudofrankia]MDT3438693.1 mycothiol synthase [Pseudofrankia sp. BMG5.37]OHV56361.1 mycothiol synthase [Pseudofrankia sp. BMG5.36]